MLRHLRVTNFAILSDVSLDLVAGFNVLTGETGAGKSLIVEAVNLLRGGRASADIPRAGADEAVVEAQFELPELVAHTVADKLAEAGLPDGHGELLVRRVIHRGGRSRTYVNGALTTATRLSQIAAHLVDLSGQHQHQGLTNSATHRAITDAFANNGPLVEHMRSAHQTLSDLRAQIDRLAADSAGLEDRIDYLRYQLDELDRASLRAGEEEALEAEIGVLRAADKLRTGAARAEGELYSGDDSAIDRLDAAVRELDRLVEVDATLAPLRDQLGEARSLTADCAAAVRDYADNLTGNPARLEEADDRLALIRRLMRKHGGSVDEVLRRQVELRTELDTLENRDTHLGELEAAHRQALSDAATVARALTASREKAARRLEREVGSVLAEMGMSGASLKVVLEPNTDADGPGPTGAERIEFLLIANSGEAAKPLAKIASGGELSRIMLALKGILRRAERVACCVFDEVDTGVGGATAGVVGQRIRAIADERQVLCVTHLAQIAVFADAHFHVEKKVVGGRTETDVIRLKDRDRQTEIARMLGGLTSAPQARAHARELLRAAQRAAG